MLTDDQLRAIMPRATAARRSAMLPFLQAAITEFGIAAPARQAAFLAQLAHESGEFRFMEEIWGPTDAQRRYEPVSSLATTLGNTEAGDGKRFKGRGPIQITGRDNYRRFGDMLGVDLVADPPRAALPELGFRIAGLFWQQKGLNELADLETAEAFRTITRRINGGLNGIADRERFHATARRVLIVPAEGTTVGLRPRRGRATTAMPDEPPFARGAEAIRADRARRRRPAPSKRGKKKQTKKKQTTKKQTTRGSTTRTKRTRGAARKGRAPASSRRKRSR